MTMVSGCFFVPRTRKSSRKEDRMPSSLGGRSVVSRGIFETVLFRVKKSSFEKFPYGLLAKYTVGRPISHDIFRTFLTVLHSVLVIR